MTTSHGALRLSPPLVVLGCGFTGTAAAKQALAARRTVVATTRTPERAASLRALGFAARAVERLATDDVRALVPEGAHVLVAFPPDGQTDELVAAGLARAGAIAYISTTGVYGAARGRVDESTPVDPSDPRALVRLEAEQAYLRCGATVLRAAGIYGPGRGLHVRVREAGFGLSGGGREVVSRVHVDDLARIALRALELGDGRGGAGVTRGRAFVVADDRPAPQVEVVQWLSAKLGIAMPESGPAPAESAGATGQGATRPGHRPRGRTVDNAQVKAVLGLDLLYPSYKEGFAACLETEDRL